MNALTISLAFALYGSFANAESFLMNREIAHKSDMTAIEFQSELSNAMDEALGCGGHVTEGDILRIEEQLMPMWRTLPKNTEGNVDRHALRSAIHTHFNRRWAIHIRGFEPSRLANASDWGSDDILGQRVPAYVETVLESKHKLMRGFTLNDAAHMVATVEQLIYDWEGTLLAQSYAYYDKSLYHPLSSSTLVDILDAYVISWLLRTDDATTFMLLTNRTQMEQVLPQWGELQHFVRGSVQAFELRRRWSPMAAMKDGIARRGHNALASRFSFEDAHSIIGGIRQSFAAFWDAECSSLKSTLLDMDTHRTGRVPLSRFYGTGMEADWRFGESEAYLRELGALDETSRRGKQVIISNYMQAATNCVASTPHYLVCCINDCEPLLGEIEAAIAAPMADPQKLLEVVKGMTTQSTLDDDFPPPLGATLPSQLEQIAAANNGKVPLRSRLFAQWLHYAFPRECPFPREPGTVSSVPPSEYGEDFYASPEEMEQHVLAPHVDASNISAALGSENLEWMSQWSPLEESDAELAVAMQAPWEQRGSMVTFSSLGLFAVALLALFVSPRFIRSSGSLPINKQHYV